VTGQSRVRELSRAGGIVGAAMLLMNFGTYVFTIAAARLLGPSSFGALSALVGILIIGNVVSNGLQATGARRIAERRSARAGVEHGVLRLGRFAGLGLFLLLTVTSPVLAEILNIASPLPVVLAGMALAPLTLVGAQLGILQGERRWSALALVYICSGVGRVACGMSAILLRPDVVGAMAGVTAGTVLPAVVGAFAVRRTAATAPHSPDDESARSLALEIAHSSHMLFAFFVLSNLDVLLARIVLTDHDSGLYAAGLIVAKACLFLPQFVVIVMFPDMAEHSRSGTVRRHALGAVGAVGGAAIAATWLFQDLVVTFVGGSAYAEIGPMAWLFAAVGVTFAWLQILVYGSLASRQPGAVVALWAAAVVLAVAALSWASTVTTLVATVLGVALTLVVGWFAVSRRRSAG
jgi:O-antigen/teichoic acid export membrane protein